jgi:Raf kinase inhibitor-like YbhB/YbcL family protein
MSEKVQAAFTITSPAFDSGGMMPPKHSLNNENVSPGIAWEGVPEGTRSLVIIMEDSDVPTPRIRLFTWVHWIVYNVLPDLGALPEALPVTETLESGALQGRTSFRKSGYGGPAPLSGTHRYNFKAYAVDTMLDLEPKKATKKRILKAIQGHILAESELTGCYKR